jgi:hypothetical protein
MTTLTSASFSNECSFRFPRTDRHPVVVDDSHLGVHGERAGGLVGVRADGRRDQPAVVPVDVWQPAPVAVRGARSVGWVAGATGARRGTAQSAVHGSGRSGC